MPRLLTGNMRRRHIPVNRRRNNSRNSGLTALLSESHFNEGETEKVRLASNSKNANNMKDLGKVRVPFYIFKTGRHITSLTLKGYNCMDLEDKCPICLDDFSEKNAKDVCSFVKVDPTAQDTILQSCPHMCCKKCVKKLCVASLLKKERPKCPCCRKPFIGSIQFDFEDKGKKMISLRKVSFLAVPMLKTFDEHFLDLAVLKQCNCGSHMCASAELKKLLLLEAPYMNERDTIFFNDQAKVLEAQNFYAMSAFALSDTSEVTQEWKNFRVTRLRYKLTSYKRNKRKWNRIYPLPFEVIFPNTDHKMMFLSEKLKEYDQRASGTVNTIDLL